MCHDHTRWRHGSGCCRDDNCCHPGGTILVRRFLSNREKREHLEAYRDELKSELEGIEERINELRESVA